VLPDHSQEEARIISVLSASSRATIARINYRASPEHQYPTPYHDVLFGYDWIIENLLRQESDPLARKPLAQLGVCGELVGGSLATMLALTECQRNKHHIIAAAVNNPIVDWVFPGDLPLAPPAELPEPARPDETQFPADQDPMTWWIAAGKEGLGPTSEIPTAAVEESVSTSQKRLKRAPKPPPPTSWERNSDNGILPTLTLSGERDVLFRQPEDYLDRFASPIHFFRSPHGLLIYPPSNDFVTSSSPSEQPQDPFDWETRMDIVHFESMKTTPALIPQFPTLVRCRAYARIYPPSGTNLALPQWHITSGTTSPLLDQALELAKMTKRSTARQTLRMNTFRDLWHDPAEKTKYEAYAKERVLLNTTEGLGLWTQQDNNPDWESQAKKVGTWIGKLLRSP